MPRWLDMPLAIALACCVADAAQPPNIVFVLADDLGYDELRGIKRSMYEGGIRVPFIAHWPGTVAAGTTSAHPVAF